MKLLIKRNRFRSKLFLPNRGIIPAVFWATKDNHEKNRIPGVLAETGTYGLPNTSIQRYRHKNFLHFIVHCMTLTKHIGLITLYLQNE
jgi:hypothetical protein